MMEFGITTGPSAAAVAKACAKMLIFDTKVNSISVMTPSGVLFDADIEDIEIDNKYVSCAVRMPGEDFPGVDEDVLIYAKATFESHFNENAQVTILGGKGIGRVTKPGLNIPVGNAAISEIPLAMIEESVMEELNRAGIKSEIVITLSVPNGYEISKKLHNPRIGIEGGISIMGTSIALEPVGTRAKIDTIHMELNQRHALGFRYVAVALDDHGREFLKETYGYDIERSVKCIDFLGETIDHSKELGFKELIVSGNIEKLIKVAGGIMNTHQRESDCRMEILSSIAILEGADANVAKNILSCVSVEEALNIVEAAGLYEPVIKRITDRIIHHLNRRADEKIGFQCIIFSGDDKLLSESKGVDKWLKLFMQEQER